MGDNAYFYTKSHESILIENFDCFFKHTFQTVFQKKTSRSGRNKQPRFFQNLEFEQAFFTHIFIKLKFLAMKISPFYRGAAALLVAFFAFSNFAIAQLVFPPAGDNQRSELSQWMGLAKASVVWSSPDVHAPNGKDRRGHIWGELVPYGLNAEGFGFSTAENPTPWRAGANECTTFEFSQDVKINGQPLAAGKYGFFIIVEKEPADWTLIFSKNSTAWGAYFYKKEEDALRLRVQPKTCPHTEWLTYEFDDRQLNSCTARMRWEEKSVEFKIETAVDQKLGYLDGMRQQLTSGIGFEWKNWQQSAQWCVDNKMGNLDEALAWSEMSLNTQNVGQKNFTTLSTKANVLRALGRTADADATMKMAIADASATPLDIHMYARGLQGAGKKQEAMEIYKINAEKNPNQWLPNLGLARGYSMLGDYSNALKHAKTALSQNPPDGQNKKTLEKAVEMLTAGKDFN